MKTLPELKPEINSETVDVLPDCPKKRNSEIRIIRMTYLMILLFCAASSLQALATTNGNVLSKYPELSTLNSKISAGDRFAGRGLFKSALKEWREAMSLYKVAPNVINQVELLRKISNAQRSLGLHRRALRSLEVANKLNQELNASSIEFQTLRLQVSSNLASAYLYVGDFSKANEMLNQALAGALDLGDKHLQALIFNDLGNLNTFQSDYKSAQAYYAKSIKFSNQINNHALTINTIINAASAASQSGDLAQSTIYASQALELLKNSLVQNSKIHSDSNSSFKKAQSIVNIANVIKDLAEQSNQNYDRLIVDTVKLLEGAAKIAKNANNIRLISRINGVLAAYYRFSEQYSDAQILITKAISAAQQIDAADLLYRWYWLAGRLSKSTGDLDEAIRYYQIGIDALQPIRHQLSLNEIGKHSNYNKLQGRLYLEMADLLLSKTDSMKDPRDITRQLLAARDIVELQKEAEFQDYFRDSCVVRAKSLVKSIDDVISEHTAVIYPILLPKRTELLVSYASGIQRYTVDKGEEDITKQVRALRVELEKRKTRGYLPYSQKLYDWLISPLEADLNNKKIDTLVIVADQSLRTIPLSVLHDGHEFLINKYAIAITPGLTLTDPDPLDKKHDTVLISGLSESVQGYPALKHVRGELEEIQDIYLGKLLMNKDFVTQALDDSLRNAKFSIAHIASHSVFTGNVKDSYILTFDGRMTVDNLGKAALIRRDRGNPISLLTLSACQTAAGDDRAALGLAGIAIKSGAKSALATLWTINDRASALLITEFYRQISTDKVSKAQALKTAQIKLMQNVRYRHPGFWSPFLLIGNWL